jgi:hypothetical protein
VTAAAALAGAIGLQAQGNDTNYVQFDFGSAANPATATYDARFSFRPNGNTSTGQDILVGRTTGGTTLFRVRYRINAGTPQVQIQVGTGTGNAAWDNISGGASVNGIEAIWQAVGSGGAAPGTLKLYINGSAAPAQNLAVTSTSSVGSVRLGSVTSGVASSILEHFDAFASKRSTTPYGP